MSSVQAFKRDVVDFSTLPEEDDGKRSGQLFHQAITGSHKGVTNCNRDRAEGEAIGAAKVLANKKADEMKLVLSVR